jgi:NADH-quinone oxidoreductase subunit A
MITAIAPFLAQVTSPADVRSNWLPVLMLLIIGILFAVGSLTMSIIVGPSRNNPGKEGTYESGMKPVGDSRKRFNVRFYVVAMIFLVLDVDIIFFYPLCSIFRQTAMADHVLAGALMVEILLFVAVLVIAYVYAWGKGVFRWD